jgi:hypothetical protein
MASELRQPDKYNGDFPETTVYKGYAMKASEKANITGLTSLSRVP